MHDMRTIHKYNEREKKKKKKEYRIEAEKWLDENYLCI